MTATLPLVVENLSFRYRDRQETAIQDISFSADKGEILLIAGASGCDVIAITGNALSLLAQQVDVVLLSVSHEARTETTASRVAQQALIYALYTALAMRSVSKTIEADQIIWKALMRKNPFQSKS